ncbi:ion channel [Crocosphaera sp. UHCC 0190]|uniref:ion channel n=1 Tax=Crocosphaera sp. UHCC 0190 TaxID=3110246 RepID=UPI002B20DE4B|nr:ion channel [Crocosphaera sp. UHCC 0190]MEA5509726.1 ion channel [Crocosphaera sp. UHCC 0190]
MKNFKLQKILFRGDHFFFRNKSSLKPIKPKNPLQQIDLLHPARNDLYHWLLALSWPRFLLLTTIFYLGINIIFASAYLTTGEGIVNAKSGSFKDAFFFSIQTLSTVGYGSMYPETLYAQILVTLEVWTGLLLLTILTGLMFARFSRPTARVLFSQVAVICPFNGVPTLIFRAANQRENQILEAQIRVSLVRNEISSEGHYMRRFYDLELLRSQTPIFGLSWQIMHPIDEKSPLFGTSSELLAEEETELWVTLTGLDETFSQTIHARYFYNHQQILWDQKLVDIFRRSPDGKYYIDISRFHDVVPFSSR